MRVISADLCSAAVRTRPGDGDFWDEGCTIVLPLAVARGSTRIPVRLGVSRRSLGGLMRDALPRLHPRERRYFDNLIADARRQSFLLGRYVAKLALVNDVGGSSAFEDIEIAPGVFRQPVVRWSAGDGSQVSISHCGEWGAALVFPEAHPMAVDIERVDEDGRLASVLPLCAGERELFSGNPFTDTERYAALWTMKEALSKVLRTGLTVDFGLLEINKPRFTGRHIECLFTNFPQYRAVTWLFEGVAWSIVLPKNSHLDVDALVGRQEAHLVSC